METTTQTDSQRPSDRLPSPGDTDMIHELKDLFMKMGLHDKLYVFDNNIHLRSAVGKHWELQRWYLNRFMYAQLLCVPNYPITMSTAMLRDGAPADWLHNARVVLLPFLIENNLPV